MSRWQLLAALVVPAAVVPALADLPGTLNFSNQTGSRVSSNTAEIANNEKEVDLGDFDEDGDLDIVIANAYSDFGARKNKLYRNNAGTFQEITTSGAIPGFSLDQVSRNAFLRDYNGDGHLDIWIINDANSDPNQLFLAVWVAGQFSHFQESFNFVTNGSTSLGAACSGWSADFDQDGDADVFCANYPNSSQDQLVSSNNNGTFTNITSANMVINSGDYNVDACGADMNGDGLLDLVNSQHGTTQNSIFYNNNGNSGTGPGDFSYVGLGGSQQFLGNPSNNENSIEAGDFDSDGDMDLYHSDGSGVTGDYISRNTGNDANNKAVLSTAGIPVLPASVNNLISRKVAVADLNADGRVDAFVMKEEASNSRPTVLRNVTVNGVIEFVDWTPAPAFPTGNLHKGWHARAFDSNSDGDLDIFIGGWAGDHLIEHVASTEYTEAALGGSVPSLFNQSPAAIVGSVGPGAPDVYTASGFTAASIYSVVINGADDYRIEILDGADAVLATINRGGLGVEEATTYDPASMPATVKVRVTALACANAYNVSGDCGINVTDFLDVLAAWGPNPGNPADVDDDGTVGINDFLLVLGGWGDSNYVLELLGRDG
jgi:hypothetical protein